MKTNTILSITITELERLKAGVVTVLTNLTGPESFVVVKGRSQDGLAHFVLGVLYPDQIPPTGEKEGFRIQRIQDLNGVYVFNEVDAHFNAVLSGADVLPYRVWLASEIKNLDDYTGLFRSMLERFEASVKLVPAL